MPARMKAMGMKTLAAMLATLALAAPSIARAQGGGDCGCLDLVLVIDNTASMGPAIDNVKAGLTNIIADAKLVSNNDLRLGLVTFPEDNIVVNQPLTADLAEAEAAVNAIALGGGGGAPESSDESLRLVVTGSASPGCAVEQPKGPFGAFRPQCTKIAVLITDQLPGGCDDTFTAGVDDVNAAAVASSAAAAGILISAIQVGGAPVGTLADIMRTYADTSGGVYNLVPANGAGTSDAIRSIIGLCGRFTPPESFLPTTKPATHTGCITRNARYWFSTPYSDNPNCATLLKAIQASDDQLRLGFLRLPDEFRNADSVKDEVDALIEALGLFWRSSNRTGEDGGTQNQGLRASKLCRQRKRLAVELIAAIANNALLGTAPRHCTYVHGGVTTNFPADLIEQAGAAAAGERVNDILAMTALLRKFNNSGLTNDFRGGLVECSGLDRKTLRNIARDPSSQRTCPGINDSCETATPLGSFPHNESLNLSPYTDSQSGPSCVTGGREAVWRISPPVAAPGRSFTVDTSGSNFDTVISVRRDLCNVLSEVACRDAVVGPGGEQVTFTTDGTATYFILIEGKNGAYGKLKLNIISH